MTMPVLYMFNTPAICMLAEFTWTLRCCLCAAAFGVGSRYLHSEGGFELPSRDIFGCWVLCLLLRWCLFDLRQHGGMCATCMILILLAHLR